MKKKVVIMTSFLLILTGIIGTLGYFYTVNWQKNSDTKNIESKEKNVMEAVFDEEEINRTEPAFKEEPPRETTKYIENVWMEIKEGTLTRSGATIIIYDNNTEHFRYHEKFRIEKYTENGWELLPFLYPDIGFNEIGTSPAKESPIEMQQNWERYFGELSNGKYRLVKSVADIDSYNGKQQYFYVEFTIDM